MEISERPHPPLKRKAGDPGRLNLRFNMNRDPNLNVDKELGQEAALHSKCVKVAVVVKSDNIIYLVYVTIAHMRKRLQLSEYVYNI